MDYCGPQGIPHSHFLGGPPVWTAADRDKALAWQEQQRRVHAACGTDPAEWDPELGGDPFAWEYVADICPGCEARDRAERRLREAQQGEPELGEVLVRRRPTDPRGPA